MTRPCCSVAAKLNAATLARLDADLRAGGPDNSVRKVADRYRGRAAGGRLSHGAVQDHKADCLRLRGQAGPQPAGQPSTDSGAASADTSSPQGATKAPESRNGADGLNGAANGVPDAGPEGPNEGVRAGAGEEACGLSVDASASARQPRVRARDTSAISAVSDPVDAAEQEARIRAIADIVATDLWRGLPTVRALSAKWRLPADEVVRLHRLAARHVEAARGSAVAQRETAIATTQRLLRADSESADAYDAEARDALKKATVATDREQAVILTKAARAARYLAGTHRTGALLAQKHLSELTVLKPPRVQVQVQILGEAQFERGFAAIQRVLDVVAPGLALVVEEGLTVLEDGGDLAFEAWLAERAADRLALPAAGYEVQEGGEGAPAA